MESIPRTCVQDLKLIATSDLQRMRAALKDITLGERYGMYSPTTPKSVQLRQFEDISAELESRRDPTVVYYDEGTTDTGGWARGRFSSDAPIGVSSGDSMIMAYLQENTEKRINLKHIAKAKHWVSNWLKEEDKHEHILMSMDYSAGKLQLMERYQQAYNQPPALLVEFLSVCPKYGALSRTPYVESLKGELRLITEYTQLERDMYAGFEVKTFTSLQDVVQDYHKNEQHTMDAMRYGIFGPQRPIDISEHPSISRRRKKEL